MTREIQAELVGDSLDGSSNNEFVLSIMDKIASAETFDDIFAAQESGLVSGKDFVNRPFVINGREAVEWRKSDQKNTDQGGYLFYAILHVTPLDTGEEMTIACGGKTFVAVLHALRTRGYFDEERTMIITSVESREGAYLQLKPVPKRAEPARVKK
jgi:hypothetical protein